MDHRGWMDGMETRSDVDAAAADRQIDSQGRTPTTVLAH